MNPTSETGAAPTTAPVPQDRTRRECSARRRAILELAGDYLTEIARACGLGQTFRRRWAEARDAVLATEGRPVARELFRRAYARQASHLRATHVEAIASIALASVNHRRHAACPEN
jgi:hypothetical protein